MSLIMVLVAAYDVEFMTGWTSLADSHCSEVRCRNMHKLKYLWGMGISCLK